MCGIVGVIAKNSKLPWHADDLFEQMLYMDTIRGPDSTGSFGVTRQGVVDIIKGDAPGHLFIESSAFLKFKNKICNDYLVAIGHNRKATKGTVNPHNAHPFRVENIVLVHNGTIQNANDLNTEVEVDSHAIAHALAKHDCVTALGKINGAFALVWFDQKDKTLNLARNTERPLYLVEYTDMWVISSEVGLPVWLQNREHRKHTAYRLMPTDKILVFNIDNLNAGPFEVPYEKYRSWSPPVIVPPAAIPFRKQEPVILQNSPVALAPKVKESFRRIVESEKLQMGSPIRFKMVDYKTEEASEVVIGHPIFGSEVDTNIIVRGILAKGMKIEDIIEDNIFTAKCQHFRPMGGVAVIYVENIQPVKIVTDISGDQADFDEVSQILLNGCNKCQKSIPVEEIGQSILRKKKDGTGWRVICHACREESRENAMNSGKAPISLAH